MNIITQRELEIEEFEKDIEKLSGERYKMKKSSKGELQNNFILLTLAQAKLQTLKKILAEEKEFVKRLKNYLDCDWSMYSKDTQQVVKDILDFIDNISIHTQPEEISESEAELQPLTETSGRDNISIHTCQSEPSTDGLGDDPHSGSSNLCKNCGHSELFHPIRYIILRGRKILAKDKGEIICEKFEPQGCGKDVWINGYPWHCGDEHHGELVLCPECKKSQGCEKCEHWESMGYGDQSCIYESLDGSCKKSQGENNVK